MDQSFAHKNIINFFYLHNFSVLHTRNVITVTESGIFHPRSSFKKALNYGSGTAENNLNCSLKIKHFFRFQKQCCGFGITDPVTFWHLDQGSRTGKKSGTGSGIQDGKNLITRSGMGKIRIRDPQHCSKYDQGCILLNQALFSIVDLGSRGQKAMDTWYRIRNTQNLTISHHASWQIISNMPVWDQTVVAGVSWVEVALEHP